MESSFLIKKKKGKKVVWVMLISMAKCDISKERIQSFN